jgi:hypothetical protein
VDRQPSPLSDELDEQLLQRFTDRLGSHPGQKALGKYGRRFVSARKEGRYPYTRFVVRFADPDTGRQWDDWRSVWDMWTPQNADLDYMVNDLMLFVAEPCVYYGEDQPDLRST